MDPVSLLTSHLLLPRASETSICLSHTACLLCPSVVLGCARLLGSNCTLFPRSNTWLKCHSSHAVLLDHPVHSDLSRDNDTSVIERTTCLFKYICLLSPARWYLSSLGEGVRPPRIPSTELDEHTEGPGFAVRIIQDWHLTGKKRPQQCQILQTHVC